MAREGYRVSLAKDGVEALEIVLDPVPDVMLVDIEMPRMAGVDLTCNVRADARLKHVPIIMITSRTAETATMPSRSASITILANLIGRRSLCNLGYFGIVLPGSVFLLNHARHRA
jgi:CheY-like chemotaxis protein